MYHGSPISDLTTLDGPRGVSLTDDWDYACFFAASDLRSDDGVGWIYEVDDDAWNDVPVLDCRWLHRLLREAKAYDSLDDAAIDAAINEVLYHLDDDVREVLAVDIRVAVRGIDLMTQGNVALANALSGTSVQICLVVSDSIGAYEETKEYRVMNLPLPVVDATRVRRVTADGGSDEWWEEEEERRGPSSWEDHLRDNPDVAIYLDDDDVEELLDWAESVAVGGHPIVTKVNFSS